LTNALGQSHVVPAAVAAWSSNLIFGLFGLWLFLKNS